MLTLVTTHRREPKQVLAADAGTTILVPLGDGRVRVLRANEAMARGEARAIRARSYHTVVETGPSGGVDVPVRLDLEIDSSEDGEATAHVRYSSSVADIASLVRSWRPGEDAEAPVEAAVMAHVVRACGRFRRTAIHQVEDQIRHGTFTFRGLQVTIETCVIGLSPESTDRLYETERMHRERVRALDRAALDEAKVRARAAVDDAEAEARQRAEIHARDHAQNLTRMGDNERIERQNRAERLIPGWNALPILTQLRLLATDLSADSIAEVMQEIRQEEHDDFMRRLAVFRAKGQLGVLDDDTVRGMTQSLSSGLPRTSSGPRPGPAEPPVASGEEAATPAEGDVIDVHVDEGADGSDPGWTIDDELELRYLRDAPGTAATGDDTAQRVPDTDEPDEDDEDGEL